MNQLPARIGNNINRITSVLSLILVVWFFFLLPEKTTTRQVLFFLWMAYAGYSTVKMISELAGGARVRETHFITMLDRWQEERGSRSKALAAFTAITAFSAVIKLGIPLLLLLV